MTHVKSKRDKITDPCFQELKQDCKLNQKEVNA
jgi:hypothetical protein